MKLEVRINIFKENLKVLDESVRWLKRSYHICSEEFNLASLSDNGYDAFEGLTARFARTVDVFTAKVFRSVVYLEEGKSLSWIDTVLFLENKGIIGQADNIRILKELRNEIVHEYSVMSLLAIFKEVLNQCRVLFGIIEKTEDYSYNLLDKLEKGNL